MDKFNGIQTDRVTGRLVPTAHKCGMIKTFETGRTPSREVFIGPEGDGSDVTGDGSFERPFATFGKAFPVEPGTAIRLKPGNYGIYLHVVNLHGTESDPIWIGGIPGEARPVFTGGDTAVTIQKGSYIVIHDLEVAGTKEQAHGIHLNEAGDGDDSDAIQHITVRGCYLYNIWNSPIKMAGVNRSFIYDNEFAFDLPGCRNSGTVDQVGCHYNTVAYNYFHDLTGIGVVNKGGSLENDIFGNLFVNAGCAVTVGQSTGVPFFRPHIRFDGEFKNGEWNVREVLPNRDRYEARGIRVYSNIMADCAAGFTVGPSTECYAVNNTVINPTQYVLRILNMDPGDMLKLGNFAKPHGSFITDNVFCYGADLDDPFNTSEDSLESFTFTGNMLYSLGSPGSQPKNIGKFREEDLRTCAFL